MKELLESDGFCMYIGYGIHSFFISRILIARLYGPLLKEASKKYVVIIVLKIRYYDDECMILVSWRQWKRSGAELLRKFPHFPYLLQFLRTNKTLVAYCLLHMTFIFNRRYLSIIYLTQMI